MFRSVSFLTIVLCCSVSNSFAGVIFGEVECRAERCAAVALANSFELFPAERTAEELLQLRELNSGLAGSSSAEVSIDFSSNAVILYRQAFLPETGRRLTLAEFALPPMPDENGPIKPPQRPFCYSDRCLLSV